MNILKVFYIYVLVVCGLNIYFNLNDIFSISVFLSALGLISTVLFFLKKYNFYYLGIFWVIIQIPYVVLDDMTFNLSQFIDFKFGFNIGSLGIGVNIQVLLLFVVKYLVLSKYLNQKITVTPYTESAKDVLGESFSFTPTTITESKNLKGVINMQVNEINYSEILFSPTKDERLKKATIILVNSLLPKTVKGLVTYSLDK